MVRSYYWANDLGESLDALVGSDMCKAERLLKTEQPLSFLLVLFNLPSAAAMAEIGVHSTGAPKLEMLLAC